ncbi:MAG: Hsp20/alpha crystallin family protein, partial [Halothece sp.]
KREGIANVFPSAEMEETDDAIHLRLEIPGIKPEDLDIQASAEAVSIRGERKSESKTEDKGMTRTEFYYGQFERVIPLSTRINSKDVKAEYKNGIVELTLPKAEDEKEKTVKVTINS